MMLQAQRDCRFSVGIREYTAHCFALIFLVCCELNFLGIVENHPEIELMLSDIIWFSIVFREVKFGALYYFQWKNEKLK